MHLIHVCIASGLLQNIAGINSLAALAGDLAANLTLVSSFPSLFVYLSLISGSDRPDSVT
jgi:hypothetical protein